jgi:RNA polymerase sigma factor FliA
VIPMRAKSAAVSPGLSRSSSGGLPPSGIAPAKAPRTATADTRVPAIVAGAGAAVKTVKTVGPTRAPAGKSAAATLVPARRNLAQAPSRTPSKAPSRLGKPMGVSTSLHSVALHSREHPSAEKPAADSGAEIGADTVEANVVAVNAVAANRDIRALAESVQAAEGPPVVQDRRDAVVLEHLPLVKAIAVRVHENLPVHVDLDDLVHAGILGLFDAANKYNPEKQVVFSSYAKHRIKGAILDSLRQLDWASRDMRRRHKQVEAATRDLSSELQRAPTEAEVAQKLGMDVDRWRNMMLDLRNVGLISASTRGNENDDLPAPDFPSKPETQPDSICAREQLRTLLKDAMKALPERYRKVVLLYYTNEMTMKEIGGILGINESRVSQIHKSALEKMATVLEANGITSSQAF